MEIQIENFRLLQVLKKDSRDGGILQNIRHVVLDEADLLFSYGYRDEIEYVLDVQPFNMDR